jgi:valyl-tRNA synthetase
VAETKSIRSLGGKQLSDGKLDFLGPDAERPSGCAAFVPSTDLTVYLEIRGQVDAAAGLMKLESRLQKTNQQLQKQRALLGGEEFKERTSAATLETEHTRLAEFEAEQRGLEATIEQFRRMDLEAKGESPAS